MKKELLMMIMLKIFLWATIWRNAYFSKRFTVVKNFHLEKYQNLVLTA